MDESFPRTHSHVFLGEGHEQNERRTWMVIALCSVMMVAEIVGGLLFGSIALVADGLHMSTHASALLLAALAYSYARRHAKRFAVLVRHRQARRSRWLFKRHCARHDCASDRV
jgi:Co/Zn/Cd efflux system component